MASLVAIGECMLELRTDPDNRLIKSFAGDTYNSVVYAKRYFPSAEFSYLSAVGNDPFSEEMVERWQSEGVSLSWLQRSPDKQVGIYAISTDEHGERSFSYWRKESAATQTMQLLDETFAKDTAVDVVYFSGISLAVLSDTDKQKLIDFVGLKREQGAQIAFDPNYRPKMWRDKDHAIEWLEKAYASSDILLPGLEDHEDLLGHKNRQEVQAYLSAFSLNEIVMKCGAEGVYAYDSEGSESHVPFTPAPKQVDSTAAGDSFAGTYLAARMAGESIKQAVESASKVAGIVVQHPGAIIDRSVYQDAIR